MGLGVQQRDDKQFEEDKGQDDIIVVTGAEAALVFVAGQTQIQNPLLAMHDRPFKNITVERFDANHLIRMLLAKTVNMIANRFDVVHHVGFSLIQGLFLVSWILNAHIEKDPHRY